MRRAMGHPSAPWAPPRHLSRRWLSSRHRHGLGISTLCSCPHADLCSTPLEATEMGRMGQVFLPICSSIRGRQQKVLLPGKASTWWLPAPSEGHRHGFALPILSARSSRNNSGDLNCLGFWGTVTTCPPVQLTASVVREQGVQRTTPCLSPNSSTVLCRAEILWTHRCTHVLDQIGKWP